MSELNYTIKSSKRARNIKVSVNSQGKIILTKPYFVPQFIAVKFLNSQKDWIEKQISRLNLKPNGQNSLYYLGNNYPINFSIGRFSYRFSQNELFLSGPTPKSATSALKKDFQTKASQQIHKSVKLFSAQMHLYCQQIRLKDQDTRWGSCSSKQNLNFNWRLIMAPPAVLDYVVIHELAHLKHMDHSLSFYQLVEKYDPDYRDHRRWLKRHGHLLKNL